METPAGWYQVLRGPRPKSVQWPRRQPWGLKEARRAAQGRPFSVQMTECQGFIQRSQNRLRQMEEERVAEQKTLDGAPARLSRLREEMARNPDPPPNVTRPASTQPAQNAHASVGERPRLDGRLPSTVAGALSKGGGVAVLQFSAKLAQDAECDEACDGGSTRRGAFRSKLTAIRVVVPRMQCRRSRQPRSRQQASQDAEVAGASTGHGQRRGTCGAGISPTECCAGWSST